MPFCKLVKLPSLSLPFDVGVVGCGIGNSAGVGFDVDPAGDEFVGLSCDLSSLLLGCGRVAGNISCLSFLALGSRGLSLASSTLSSELVFDFNLDFSTAMALAFFPTTPIASLPCFLSTRLPFSLPSTFFTRLPFSTLPINFSKFRCIPLSWSSLTELDDGLFRLGGLLIAGDEADDARDGPASKAEEKRDILSSVQHTVCEFWIETTEFRRTPRSPSLVK
jgi:hypothetical protein